jgi:hypothetical protein
VLFPKSTQYLICYFGKFCLLVFRRSYLATLTSSSSHKSYPFSSHNRVLCGNRNVNATNFVLFFLTEYLDDHPCLCTSRFRHTLHQLDQERHKRLADLCSALQKLTMVSGAARKDEPRKYSTANWSLHFLPGLGRA